jgi:peptidoglycan/LPS O-acetylase OafA/YrhL
MSFISIFSKQQENRVFGLDIIRATAILLVLLGHGYSPFLAEHFPNLRYLIFIDGVDLFFVLSGFLIGSILIKQFENNDGYKLSLIFSFWKRRWMRTLPNYYFVFLIILFIPVILPFLRGKQIAIPFDVWSPFLIFSQNLVSPQVVFFAEAWSLAVEEWFYLMIPVILWIFFHVLKKYFSKQKIFLLLIIGVIVSETSIRFEISKHSIGGIHEWDSQIRKVVFTRLDSIIYGVLGAFLKFYYPTFWQKKSLLPFLNILGILCLAITNYKYLLADENEIHLFMNVFYFSLSGIGVLLLLPQMDAIKNPPRGGFWGISGKIITHISLISYSLYLTHGYLILEHLKRYRLENFNQYLPNTPATGILYFGVFLLVSTLVSTALHYSIEKPFMNLRGI